MKFFKRARKLFAVLSSILMLVQPILPVFPSLLHPVYAQEATASSEQPSPTPTEEVTPSPTEEPTPIPTEEVTPTVEPTPSETPVPTETVEPTPTQSQEQPPQPTSEPPKETGPPPAGGQEQGQILDGVSTTPTPTVTVEEPVEEGELQAVILQNVEAESLNLDNVDPSNSATLTTDKADYAPTDTAVITGTDFTLGETYSLTISSNDQPPTSTTVEVTTDENGSFVYAYQLDGIYRPNYKVEVKNNATVVAETTFTDTAWNCQNDAQGANDEPGQKDLTKMCRDNDATDPVLINWNWDDTGWSGSNTGDACALFDTNSNGKANYAVCVQVDDTPASFDSQYVYSCDDSSAERCYGSALDSSVTTTCSASVQAGANPFDSGSDTVANCNIPLSDVGGLTATLLDVCSYPSAQPNSDPSDCIVASTASQTGLLEVKKALDPTSDPGRFNLQIDGVTYATDATHNGTTGEKELDTGNHTFGETAGTGTSLTNYTTTAACVNATGAPVSITGTTNPWTVNVGNNDDITCTITNTRMNNASLTIVKDAVPNDPQDFAFTTSGTGLSNFSLDNDTDGTLSDTQVFNGLAAGTYSVAETVPTGWVQTSATCNDGSPVTAIVLSAGENVTCTFTNTKKGQIIVEKQTLPDSAPQSFNFTADYDGDGFSLTDGEQNDSGLLVPGSYTIGETVPTGWNLTGIVCTDPTQNSSSNLPTAPTATVNLAAGETVTCVFTNTQRGHIIVDKITNPSGSDQSFDFDATGSGYIDFSLTDAATANDQEVVPGTYSASETVPTGWDQTSATCDQGETVDSIDVGAGETVTCTFTNTKRRDITACKFNDVNGNGVRNDGDALLDGWDMTLNPGNVTQGTTSGCTTFSNLSPGSYSVTETLKTDWSNTTNLSQNVTLTANQNETVYFGNFACATISGQKWEDLNGDGVWDDGEPTLPGWTINLNGDGPTDTTDEDGNYSFKVCQGGQATVSESFPDNSWYQTSPGGASPNYQIDVTSGGSYTGKDFGNAKYARIWGIKYRDDDGNGVIDASDAGATLAGWIFELYDDANNLLQTSLATLSNGFYEFTGLRAGKGYYVKEQNQTGWTQTIGSPSPTPMILQSGDDKQVDFANFENISISGQKFNDVNGDGDKDGGEPGLSGWTINLDKDANGSVDVTTTTDGSGNYAFADLEPGTYRVREVGQTGWTQTTANPSDITASSGQNIDDVDFGNFELGVIQSRKYEDVNADSTRDTGEPYLSGWTIILYNGDWSFNQQVVTGHTGTLGQYRFEDLPLGTYYICEVVQSGWSQTDPGPSEGFANLSGAGNEAPRCRRFIVDQSGDETIGERHFGNAQNGSISGYKFSDQNGNGAWDPGEPALDGWTITLTGTSSDSAVTGAGEWPDGYYEFTDLGPGSYNVSEEVQTGWVQTTLPTSYDETLESNIDLTDRNFGNRGSLSILACKYEDLNGTGEGISGPTVSGWSFTVGGVTQQTEENGCTVFENLTPGEYTASELPLPDGWFVADDSNGEKVVILTDERETVNFYNYQKATITVVKDVVNPQGGDVEDTHEFTVELNGDDQQTIAEPLTQTSYTVDPGSYTISELDDLEYEELGCRLPTGAPATDFTVGSNEEITVTCTNQQIPANITVVKRVVGTDGSTDVTDTSTYFSFSFEDNSPSLTDDESFSDDVNPGEYFVNEEPDSNYDFLGCEGGVQFENGVFVSLGSGGQVTVTCTNAQKPGSISGYKWNDLDGNGEWDDDESPLEDWPINFGDLNTTTDSDGYYEFTDLPAGTFALSENTQGWNQTAGPVSPVTVTSGLNLTDQNFGNQGYGQLRARKLIDADGDLETIDDQSLASGWSFDIDVWSGNGTDDAPTLTTGDNGNGQSFAETVLTGQYTIIEDIQDGYELLGASCSNDSGNFDGTDSIDDVSVGYDETVTCTFINARETGTITVDKVTDPSESSQEFTIRLSQGETTISDYVIDDQDEPKILEVPTGTYSLDELGVEGWDLTDATCTLNDGDPQQYTEGDLLELGYGDNITCTFENTQRGRVIVTKYNDENGNGTREDGEDVLSDWTMKLTGGLEETTNTDGVATFENLLPGEFTLTEVLQPGWEQTELTCNEQAPRSDDDADTAAPPPGYINLTPGETQECVVGNHRLNPILTISKSHAASDDVKNPGDSLTFTITVTATQSAAFNVFVTDLLPGGFTYRTNSWTANSSARGDLKALGITTQPTYASPGVWNLGDMEKDETVTLTYIADISTEQKPGIYKDLAWGYGCRFEIDCEVGDSNSVLSNAVSPGFVDDNFVGTQVEVSKDLQSGATLNKTEGEVLGASTELPATGADELWIKLAALFFILGIGFIAAGKYSRRLYV